MVDNGSAIDILYLNAYKRMGLTEDNLDPNNSPLYGFSRDHVVLKWGVAKLTRTIGEHPQTSTVLANFLVVDAPSTINRIIGRPLLKFLRWLPSIYHLTMKFSMAKGIGEVRGNQYDLRECYNKPFRIAKKDNKSPRTRVGKVMLSSSKRSDVTEQAHA